MSLFRRESEIRDSVKCKRNKGVSYVAVHSAV